MTSASFKTIKTEAIARFRQTPERRARANDGHDAPLDGLRGLAVLGVVLCHSVNELSGPLGGSTLVQHWLQAGCYGVDVFFVLSGFLITGILVDARGDGPRPRPHYFSAFYARRVLRIFPLYYAFLIGALWLARVATPHGVWGYWTYMVNVMRVVDGKPPNVLAPLWSLSVEEQFYILWPLVLAWGARRQSVALCLVITIASWLLAVEMTSRGAGEAAAVLTPTKAYSLGLGAFVAVGLRDPAWRLRITAWAAPVGACVGAIFAAIVSIAPASFLDGWWGFVIQSPLVALLTAACIVVVAAGERGSALRRALAWPPFVSFGIYSYAIYVLHMAIVIEVFRVAHEFLPTGVLAADMLTIGSILGLSWVAGFISRRAIEQPFLSLKKFVPMPSGDVPTSVAVQAGSW